MSGCGALCNSRNPNVDRTEGNGCLDETGKPGALHVVHASDGYDVLTAKPPMMEMHPTPRARLLMAPNASMSPLWKSLPAPPTQI